MLSCMEMEREIECIINDAYQYYIAMRVCTYHFNQPQALV